MQSDTEDEDDECPRKQNKIWPHPSGPSPMMLQTHEAINNNKTKNFQTKPVMAKPTRWPVTNNNYEAENNQNTMNTKPETVKQTILRQNLWEQIPRKE